MKESFELFNRFMRHVVSKISARKQTVRSTAELRYDVPICLSMQIT